MASTKYISSVGRWLRIVFRFGVCLVIAAFLIWYIKGIAVGNLPDNHRIDAATLSVAIIGLLVIGFFVRPDLLERLTIVQALNFRLELSQVRDNLARQNDDLRTIRMLLPFLLPSAERKHLLNLKKHQTAGYFGRSVLRTELRRLRSSELIRMRPDRHIGQMTSGSSFDLADFVALSPLGKFWAERIEEIERGEGDAADND
jgi:hypothetical protein